MADFAGRRAVVTGGAGSIGSAIAAELLENGATVAIWDLPGDGLAGARATLERVGTVHAVACDARSEASVEEATRATIAALDGVDVLVNALGILRQGRITETPTSDFDEIVAVNVRGPFLAIKHLVPAMPHGSAIVNVSSVSAYVGSDGSWAYTTTKGAVSSMTFGIAQELAPRGIRVNAVCPGWVDGGFTDHARRTTSDPEALEAAARDAHVLGRMATTREVARAVAFLASEDQASFVTGTELFVDGGFTIKR